MVSWTYRIDDEGLKVELPLRLFAWEAILAAVYPFTDRCFIFPKLTDAETVSVLFEPKAETTILLTEVAQTFFNGLIDQQLRFQLNREFGPIRNAIVQSAFTPVSKPSP